MMSGFKKPRHSIRVTDGDLEGVNSIFEVIDSYVVVKIVVRSRSRLKRYDVYCGVYSSCHYCVVSRIRADIAKAGSMPDQPFEDCRVFHRIGPLTEYRLGCIIGLIGLEFEARFLKTYRQDS